MRKFGLIGKSLDHSYSKIYFDAKFSGEDDDRSFELFPLNAIDHLPALINAEPDLKGLAVTIPYKQAVIDFLHRLDDSAALTGAVNCISIGQEWVGYNTDITGFENAFRPLLEPHHNKAMVFGTGGASKAVQYVLDKLHIPFLLVARKGGDTTYQSLTPSLITEYPVLINCTPVGMHPLPGALLPVPFDGITDRHLLFDLVYNPHETSFLKEGIKRGAKTENGLAMLELQAIANLSIWEGSHQANAATHPE